MSGTLDENIEELDSGFSEEEDVFVPKRQHAMILDARRRLENLLEEKRLRNELDDFMRD